MERADQLHLSAASGWLDLGLPDEATKELDQLSREHKKDPEVLSLRWSILASQKKWQKALSVARELVDVAPEEATGWLNQSYTLHELKRTNEAWNELIHVAAKFPKVSTIPYNLACYACQMGRLEEARKWLRRAVQVAGAAAIKATALEDPDLAPLKDEIKKLN